MRKLPLLILSGLMMFVVVDNVKGAGEMIENGKTVSFDYILTVDGETVDSSEGKKPLEYVHGQGNIIAGLEKELAGLTVGDSKTVQVSAAEGYGPVLQEAFKEVPKGQLPADMEVQAGAVLTASTQDGGAVPVIIDSVKDETVVINFNHPLAGKDLQFDVTIVEVN